MDKSEQTKKKEGIESWMIVYFSALQGGNVEKAKEAKQMLVRLGYEVAPQTAGNYQR